MPKVIVYSAKGGTFGVVNVPDEYTTGHVRPSPQESDRYYEMKEEAMRDARSRLDGKATVLDETHKKWIRIHSNGWVSVVEERGDGFAAHASLDGGAASVTPAMSTLQKAQAKADSDVKDNSGHTCDNCNDWSEAES